MWTLSTLPFLPAALLSFLSIHPSGHLRAPPMELHERPSLPEPPAPASAGSKPRHPPALCSLLLLLSLLTPSLFSLLQDLKLPWMLHRAQVQQSNPGPDPVRPCPIHVASPQVPGEPPPLLPARGSRRSSAATAARQDALTPKPPAPLAALTALVRAWHASRLATARPLACTLRRGPNRSCSSASRPKETTACPCSSAHPRPRTKP